VAQQRGAVISSGLPGDGDVLREHASLLEREPDP
jgi:hypothetical protein